MKRRTFISVLGGIASRFWRRGRIIIAAMAAMVLLPIEVSDAGWLSDVFKGSSKQARAAKQASRQSTSLGASQPPWRSEPPRQSAAL
jgi:hypothetical protein